MAQKMIEKWVLKSSFGFGMVKTSKIKPEKNSKQTTSTSLEVLQGRICPQIKRKKEKNDRDKATLC